MVPDAPPEQAALQRMRIPASHWVYREPVTVARSLHDAAFPSLARGQVPNWGFLVNMVRAFEAFVDGIVWRAVRRGRERGHDWAFESQEQRILASSVTGDGSTFYTRPDNVVWTVAGEHGGRGVVVDAKYKGLAKAPERYRRPVANDFYQVIVACLSRGWNRALIIAPTVGEEEATGAREWRVRLPSVAGPVYVGIMKLNLRHLGRRGEVEKSVERLAGYLEEILSES